MKDSLIVTIGFIAAVLLGVISNRVRDHKDVITGQPEVATVCVPDDLGTPVCSGPAK